MSSLPPNACRMRVRYIKDGRLAYLGHLEVMETVMRSIRRAHLPFEVSNGFAHRMRIQFSQALPVGAASRGEYYDLLLAEPLDVQEALGLLRESTPASIAPQEARLLPRRVPALEAWVGLSCWSVDVVAPGVDAATFDQKLEDVRERGAIEYMRGQKPKRIELARTLVSCKAKDTDQGTRLLLQTRSTERGSLRPAILVNAVCGCTPLRVCRDAQWHEEPDGTLVDPMQITLGANHEQSE